MSEPKGEGAPEVDGATAAQKAEKAETEAQTNRTIASSGDISTRTGKKDKRKEHRPHNSSSRSSHRRLQDGQDVTVESPRGTHPLYLPSANFSVVEVSGTYEQGTAKLPSHPLRRSPR